MSFDIFDVCKSWTRPQKLQKLVERDLPKCESHSEELKAEVNKAKGHGIKLQARALNCSLNLRGQYISVAQYLLYFSDLRLWCCLSCRCLFATLTNVEQMPLTGNETARAKNAQSASGFNSHTISLCLLTASRVYEILRHRQSKKHQRGKNHFVNWNPWSGHFVFSIPFL